jgi:hypothetical protein
MHPPSNPIVSAAAGHDNANSAPGVLASTHHGVERPWPGSRNSLSAWLPM